MMELDKDTMEAIKEISADERQEELMMKAVVGEATEEELEELKNVYNLVLSEEGLDELEDKDGIPYNMGIIGAFEEVSSANSCEYDKGVLEASRYVGIMHTLINGGISSQDAIVIASWIYNDGMNDKSIQGSLDNTKLQTMQQNRQNL